MTSVVLAACNARIGIRRMSHKLLSLATYCCRCGWPALLPVNAQEWPQLSTKKHLHSLAPKMRPRVGLLIVVLTSTLPNCWFRLEQGQICHVPRTAAEERPRQFYLHGCALAPVSPCCCYCFRERMSNVHTIKVPSDNQKRAIDDYRFVDLAQGELKEKTLCVMRIRTSGRRGDEGQVRIGFSLRHVKK